MQSGGAQRDDLLNALRKFNAERIEISIELKVLQGMEVGP